MGSHQGATEGVMGSHRGATEGVMGSHRGATEGVRDSNPKKEKNALDPTVCQCVPPELAPGSSWAFAVSMLHTKKKIRRSAPSSRIDPVASMAGCHTSITHQCLAADHGIRMCGSAQISPHGGRAQYMAAAQGRLL